MALELTVAFNPNRAAVGIGQLVNRLRLKGNDEASQLADALSQLESAIQQIYALIQTPVPIVEDTIRLTDQNGAVATELAPSALSIQGFQVVGPRGAAVGAVSSGPAGGAYTATEQAMLNQLKTAVGDITSRLQTHGLIG